TGLVTAVALVLAIVALGMMLVWLRHRVYHRRVLYNPRQHCILGVDVAAKETIAVSFDEGGFVLPATASGAVSAALELDVRASFLGRVLDPAIDIRIGDFHDVQYLERGVRGTRFLNVTRVLKEK